MKNNLLELTRDDWNTLFPVELYPHNTDWKGVFTREKDRILESISQEKLLRFEHFGSTSIPGLKAKPYIDMLVEIPEKLLFDLSLIEQFEKLGYTHFKVPERGDIEAYMSLVKGYELDGTKAQIFHIHMCPKSNVMWNQLKFRDFLIKHPERAKQYETLKVELADKYRNDRGAYVLGKTTFITETLKLIDPGDS